jgi:predicted flap endonuclease-1-like 5' DNA nuclease
MKNSMRNVIRFAGVAAGLAAAAWALRDRMLPDPQPPTHTPPKFRHGSGAAVEAADDLTDIKGIGPAYSARLTTAGITSFQTLASSDPRTIAEVANTTDTVAERWITAASDRT